MKVKKLARWGGLSHIFYVRIIFAFYLSWLCLSLRPDSHGPMVPTYMAVFTHFQIRNQGLWSILYFGWSMTFRKSLKETNQGSLLKMTSQIHVWYIHFHSKRGHFYFVFVKLSEIVEIVEFSCHERHSLLKKVFRENKFVQISLHLTFNKAIGIFGWKNYANAAIDLVQMAYCMHASGVF